ncbi:MULTISPECIES: hypothetical protein [Halobacterium]|uniref:DUF7553 family protein n=1 Tax=Halobacterium TaxID=2239 RepID=UPI00073F14E4|nr:MULTISPECIES: hypothetical protein [Halobacterium]MCG1004523.1 hypothetical protein [Halobacterium noricense]
MVREDLRAASDHLRAAAVAAADAEQEERLYDQSDSLAELATADDGPDHGRLARITHTLDDLASAVEDDDARESIADAKTSVEAYRETVDGV